MKRHQLTFHDRLSIREENDAVETAGWVDGPSIVQLELKDPRMVSPEIQAMMDAMQRNAMRREMVLRAEFERKLGQATAASQA